MTITTFAAKRHLIGLTIDEIATALNINPRTVRGYESGKYSPGPGVVADLEALVKEHTADVDTETPEDRRSRGWRVAVAARRLDRTTP